MVKKKIRKWTNDMKRHFIERVMQMEIIIMMMIIHASQGNTDLNQLSIYQNG